MSSDKCVSVIERAYRKISEAQQGMNSGTSDILESLLRQANTPWDGRGIPPVGANCEVLDDAIGWREAEIVAHYEGFAVAVTDGGDLNAGIYQEDECRPIRGA